MSDLERIRNILPEFARKSYEIEAQNRKKMWEFQATNPEHGAVTNIKLGVGRNLKRYGIIDPETNQILFVGNSQPQRFNIKGLPPKDTIALEDTLQELSPRFWVAASVQLPSSRLKRIWGKYNELVTWTDYRQYPLHLQIAVEETGEVKRLNFPPGLSLRKEDKKAFTKMLPLLSVIEKITEDHHMHPVTDVTKFSLQLFDRPDSETFLLPELTR